LHTRFKMDHALGLLHLELLTACATLWFLATTNKGKKEEEGELAVLMVVCASLSLILVSVLWPISTTGPQLEFPFTPTICSQPANNLSSRLNFSGIEPDGTSCPRRGAYDQLLQTQTSSFTSIAPWPSKLKCPSSATR
jgi:hypothetical protein